MIAPTFSLLGFALALVLFTSRGQLATVSPTQASYSTTESPTETNKSKMPNLNPLTSHVLDTSRGRPATGILVKLYKMDSERNWKFLEEQETNADGRVGNLVKSEDFTIGTYKLYFDTGAYFLKLNQKSFYPFVEIVFTITEPHEHYHVPILLSAFGYSTYRGS